jgi:hypothetical protein
LTPNSFRLAGVVGNFDRQDGRSLVQQRHNLVVGLGRGEFGDPVENKNKAANATPISTQFEVIHSMSNSYLP